MMAWKEAASLIIAASCASSGPGLRLLMMQRTASSSFMPNNFVFPGGHLDAADCSPAWLRHFPALGAFAASTTTGPASGPRAPMMEQYADQAVPGELSFRLCALREAFEECGLLLTGRGPRQPLASGLGPQELSRWQRRVKEDAGEYLRLHQELAMAPDVWSLREWSNWLTPFSMKKRFDTMFFVYAPEERDGEEMAPRELLDSSELVAAKWLSPEDWLRAHMTNTLTLAPPQIYELARLANFETVKEVAEFAEVREQFGCLRFCPYMIKGPTDETCFVVPGDFRYPGDVTSCHAAGPTFVEEPLADDSGPLNRFLREEQRLLCNVELCGHMPPKSLTAVMAAKL